MRRGGYRPGSPDESPPVHTVSRLVEMLRSAVEGSFPDVWVEGEVSQPTFAPSGHVYFTLKDARSVIPAVIWRSVAGRLRYRPADGDAVLCRGRLSVYDRRGTYQLHVAHLEPRGAGALAAAFEKLKARLAREGLFDADRKRPLPFLPRRVALVTSSRGAAVQDMRDTIHARFPHVELVVVPVPVQGEGAAARIAAGLDRAGRHPGVDVVVVGRGGGSLEDLWAFNEESVCRAIARCPVPVVSAVGHETDFTIADFVADARAKTPTEAGILVVPEESALRGELRQCAERLVRGVAGEVARRRRELERLRRRRSLRGPRPLLEQESQRLDEVGARVSRALRRRTREAGQALRGASRRLRRQRPAALAVARRESLLRAARGLRRVVRRLVARRRERAAAAGAHLEAVSPLRVLERGYSITRDAASGQVVRSCAEVRAGQRTETRLADGWLESVVEKVRPER